MAATATLTSGCAATQAELETGSNASDSSARFEWFEYQGQDPVFETAIAEDEFRNPIVTGFYPDPSVVRVGADYFMTQSTFGFYPGLPVFHSTDLVNWTQIGNAIDRPDMLDFEGIHLGWNGIYAPTIEYNDGVYHIITTCVGCGGDFILKASHPSGPWSDPIWISDLADTRSIDPQMFFEDDRLFIVNHENPEGPMLYDGHRAIWIREVDPTTYEIIGKKKMIVDGGINHTVEKPGYVEGPHLYRVGEFYYLSAPEGGTGMDHRQTIYRSRDIWGPYEPYENNPILTQRDLPADRPNPITSTGHADMVETQNGEWWAVFLGTRTYDTIHFATGRETFLLPVTWTDDGWPVILEQGVEVPYVAQRPNLPRGDAPARPIAGNFTIAAEFDSPLENYWTFARIPQEAWWATGNGALTIKPRSQRIGDGAQPSIISRRLHHMHSRTTTRMIYRPGSLGDEAGLIAFQNDDYYYAFGIGMNAEGETVLRLRQRNGSDVYVGGRIVEEAPLALDADQAIYLRATIEGPLAAFEYSLDGDKFVPFADGLDAKMLGSMRAGGFTGAFIGMYAETGDVRADASVKPSDLPPGVLAPATAFSKAFGSGQTYSVVGAPGIPGDEALRIVVQGQQENVWDASVSAASIPGGFVQGEELTLSFWGRATSGPGTVVANIQEAGPPHDVAISENLTLSSEWQEYSVTGNALIGFDPGSASVAILVGAAEQTLEFAQFEVRKSIAEE